METQTFEAHPIGKPSLAGQELVGERLPEACIQEDSQQAAYGRFADMLGCVMSGWKVIVGTDEPYSAGDSIIRLDEGIARVRALSTREEFLRWNGEPASLQHAPFYYDIELLLTLYPQTEMPEMGHAG